MTETKRITLDAGHHLNRMEILNQGAPPGASLAAGIRINPGAVSQTARETGVLRTVGAAQAGG